MKLNRAARRAKQREWEHQRASDYMADRGPFVTITTTVAEENAGALAAGHRIPPLVVIPHWTAVLRPMAPCFRRFEEPEQTREEMAADAHQDELCARDVYERACRK